MSKQSIIFIPYFFFVFFPFINIIPFMPFETAPYAGAYSILLLIVYYIKKTNLVVKKIHFYVALWIALTLFYFRWDIGFEIWHLNRIMRLWTSFLLGSAVFSVAYLYAHKIVKYYKIWIIFMLIWIIIGLLQLSPFHKIVDTTLQIIMTRSASFSESKGGRGIALLANEPSFAGIYLAFFLILFDVLFQKRMVSKIKKNCFQLLLIGFTLFTRSANSLLLLLFYFILKVLFIYQGKKRLLWIWFFIGSCISIYPVIGVLAKTSRAFSVLQKAIEHPELLLMDGSIADRYANLVMGYYGLVSSYGLGNGLAAYSWNYVHLAQALGFDDVPRIQDAIIKDTKVMPMSFLGGIAHDFGILGLGTALCFILRPLFAIVNKIDKRYIYFIVGFIFLLWVQTCSYALPMPWFCLGIVYGLAEKKITLVNAVNI